eukprot:UN01944
MLEQKFKRSEQKRISFRDLVHNKCEENERLYHKLQRLERRVTGVPNGNYLLKKSLDLSKKLKKLKLQTKSEEKTDIAQNLLADELSIIVNERHRFETENKDLKEQKIENENLINSLKTNVEELWKNNENLRSEREKEQESSLHDKNKLLDEIAELKTEIRCKTVDHIEGPCYPCIEEPIDLKEALKEDMLILTQEKNALSDKVIQLNKENGKVQKG